MAAHPSERRVVRECTAREEISRKTRRKVHKQRVKPA
jgi:hypothetical protein